MSVGVSVREGGTVGKGWASEEQVVALGEDGAGFHGVDEISWASVSLLQGCAAKEIVQVQQHASTDHWNGVSKQWDLPLEASSLVIDSISVFLDFVVLVVANTGTDYEVDLELLD